MPRPRSTYTPEYKLAAVKMITDQELSVAETSRRLGGVRDAPARVAGRRPAARPGRRPRPRPPVAGRRRTPPAPRSERATEGRAGHAKKTRRVLRPPAALTFAFIAEHADGWPVAWMCEAPDVSTSGCYAWASAGTRPAQQWRPELLAAIEGIHAEMRPRYGRPRTTAERNPREYACGENTVAKTMSGHTIRARQRKRFVRTTDSNHSLGVAAGVSDRAFGVERPNRAWRADITYVPTREGLLYWAAVEDRSSRMVVGGSMDDSMESRLVVDAPEMALARRRPDAGLLAHSDRGSP